jgi:hypothetical protein
MIEAPIVGLHKHLNFLSPPMQSTTPPREFVIASQFRDGSEEDV